MNDADFNKEIRRVVYNFNRKRNRALKRGFKNVPPMQYVSQLKNRYATRNEIIEELGRLESFNKMGDEALKEVETSGGAKSINWELSYLKDNIEMAKNYWNKRIEQLSRREKRFPAERASLDNAIANRESLDVFTDYMSQEQFTRLKASVRQAQIAPLASKGAYRGFLSEVESVMRMVGIDGNDIDRFMDNFSVLNADQFIELYNSSDLIARVYEIADSPTHGGLKLNTDKDDARAIMEELLNQQDEMINEALER